MDGRYAEEKQKGKGKEASPAGDRVQRAGDQRGAKEQRYVRETHAIV
jgi:hypothetical protein